MEQTKYYLYRKMCSEEANSVLKNSKLSLIKNDRLCALKCLSESLVVPYRLTPYVTNHSNIILKFTLKPETRNFLFENCLKTKTPYPDKTYQQYLKFQGKSIYYPSHGKEIDLFNFEINSEIIEHINGVISNIETLNTKNYAEILAESLFDYSLEHYLTNKDLDYGEFYIQLPYDLATIALKFQKIPRGGINKSIKARFISKNLTLLDELNNFSLPITLAIKLNYAPHNTRLKSSMINENTYGISSNLIESLNNLIANVRLVDFIPERNKHKLFDIEKNHLDLMEILKTDLPAHQSIERKENDLVKEDILNLIDSAELKELFATTISNIDPILFKTSHMHGVHHAQKTCLFAFIISNLLEYTEDEIEILIYAAFLHDIGRTSDIEDNMHGLFGAEEINNFALYINNSEKRNILKFLIECHDLELDDNLLTEKILKYNISDTYKTLRMLMVLKDSDALDRTRFTIYGNSKAGLDTSYLNNEVSHRIVAFSQDLNYAYENASISKSNKELTLKL